MEGRAQVPRPNACANDDHAGPLPSIRQEDHPPKPNVERTLGLKEIVRAEIERVPRIPEQVGQYRVLGRISEGGMAVVYEAEQRSPLRRVALKVMRQSHMVDDSHARMFRREAEALGRLRHPNIAAIFESGHTVDGQDYFAMELVRGQTLETWLVARPQLLTPAELALRLRLFSLMCEAVHYAHQRGVIHRDLKPSNVIVTQEANTTGDGDLPPPSLKILDFGLARITDEVQPAPLVSEIGIIKGTLAYMSPEQARGDGDTVDVRTDVYALGVILYEMLAGSRPYDLHGASLVDAVRKICEQPPRPLRQVWQGTRTIDPELETIIARALAKEPNGRFGSALALAEDIERYLAS